MWSHDHWMRSHDPYYRYMLRYQECIPCEQLVMQLCDIKQAYTQFGGESGAMVLCMWTD